MSPGRSSRTSSIRKYDSKRDRNARKTKRVIGQEDDDQVSSLKVDTVATQFKDSLCQLMEIILTTEPNYIRCIKPNDFKKPLNFGERQVLDQLKCNGVLEAVRIARDGFPSRVLYSIFWERFKILEEEFVTCETEEQYKAAVIELMEKHMPRSALAPQDQYQYGHTKLFLKAGQLSTLEEMRTTKRHAASITIQKIIRGVIQIEKYQRIRNSACRLQAGWMDHITYGCFIW